MTKRFKVYKVIGSFHEWSVEDTVDEVVFSGVMYKYEADRLCDELNELAEENESLKEENKFLRNKVATYKKGNTLLKSTMDKEWK